MLRAFCIGDPHFSINNLELGKLFYTSCLDTVKAANAKELIDFIVCMGDILCDHEKIDSTVLALATEFCRQLSLIAPFYLLIGNHDLPNGSCFISNQHGFNALKMWPNTYVADVPLVQTIKGQKFIFMPYTPPGRFQEALNLTGIDWKTGVSAIFAHQELYGCKEGSIMSVAGDRWQDTYPAVISGHIHQAQRVGTNILYVGTPYHTDFTNTLIGEKEDRKTVWVITFSSASPSPPLGGDGVAGGISNLHRISLNLPHKGKIVVHDINDIDSINAENNQELCIEVEGSKEELDGLEQRLVVKKAREKGIKIKTKEIGKKGGGVMANKLKLGYARALYELIDADLKELFIEIIGKV
jgi:DNA repair exonuclease SbcCD nuclease subunit